MEQYHLQEVRWGEFIGWRCGMKGSWENLYLSALVVVIVSNFPRMCVEKGVLKWDNFIQISNRANILLEMCNFVVISLAFFFLVTESWRVMVQSMCQFPIWFVMVKKKKKLK